MADNAEGVATEKRQRASGIADLLITVLLIVVFSAGLLVFSARGVTSLENRSIPGGGSEGAPLMNTINRLVSGAVKINGCGSVEESSGSNHYRFDYLEDLDGDTATGEFEVGGKKGFERIVLERGGAGGSALVAKVWESELLEPSEVVLSQALEPSADNAFYIEYLSDTARREQVPGTASREAVLLKAEAAMVDGIRVRLTVKEKSNGHTKSVQYNRVIPLDALQATR